MDEKIKSDDEGSLQFVIYIKDNHLMIDFGKPVAWLGLHKEEAVALGQRILDKTKEMKE